jgi:hypothetical protein
MIQDFVIFSKNIRKPVRLLHETLIEIKKTLTLCFYSFYFTVILVLKRPSYEIYENVHQEKY